MNIGPALILGIFSGEFAMRQQMIFSRNHESRKLNYYLQGDMNPGIAGNPVFGIVRIPDEQQEVIAAIPNTGLPGNDVESIRISPFRKRHDLCNLARCFT